MVHNPRWTVLLSFLLLWAGWLHADVPVSGKPDSRYAKFDTAIQQYMQQYDIPCATLAIRADNRLVYERGYGWCDEAKQRPVAPNAKFRIASLTKPITAAAIDALVRQKKLTLQSKAFDLLDFPLDGAGVDARLRDITVEHLVRHHGGWDSKEGSDPTWQTTPISQTLGLTRAPNPEEIVRYMTGKPLDFDPGARRAYSNLGYMILGLIINKHTNDDYYGFVQKFVFAPMGVRDAVPARSLVEDCDPLEVWYCDPRMVKPVIDSIGNANVPVVYGGFVAEYRYAVGGWAMSAASYARFMETYAIHGERYERGKSMRHSGGQPGVQTIALWRKDGTKIVAFFNRRIENSNIGDRLNAVADQVWPEKANKVGPKQR